jgi:hypothetical protein
MITNLEDERDRPLAAPYIKFNGTFSNKSITWRCDSNIAKHYLPQECQNN